MTVKGSWQRPMEVSKSHFDSEYDRIFRKPKDELVGSGDTFEEAGNVNDEMKLHGDKHKPEVSK